MCAEWTAYILATWFTLTRFANKSRIENGISLINNIRVINDGYYQFLKYLTSTNTIKEFLNKKFSNVFWYEMIT